MGHLMLSTMVKLQDAIYALTPEKDGIDGRTVYIYGEGWDFGEVMTLLCTTHTQQCAALNDPGGWLLSLLLCNVYLWPLPQLQRRTWHAMQHQ